MKRQFLLKIEGQGRVQFQIVRGHRKAMDVAQAYLTHDRNQQITILDACGRIVWQATL